VGVKVGDSIAGRYVVERSLGRGGMGHVVLARHVDLDELVAVKLVSPQHLAKKDLLARFVREAKIAARIKSEHVARVHDVGTLTDGTPFMAMEYLEGHDLATALSSGPLSQAQAVDYVLQACEALAAAHALAIIHRDIKPSNLFLARRPDGNKSLKLLDFGISKVVDLEKQELTGSQAALGSPLYMSPEQLLSARDVDVRSDLYSLGVTFFEMLTGTAPFAAEDVPHSVAKILAGDRPTVRSLNSKIPEALEAVIHRAISVDRNARYDTVAALAHALRSFTDAEGELRIARIQRILAAVDQTDPSLNVMLPRPARDATASVARSFATSIEPARPRRSWLPIAAMALLAVVGGAVWMLRGERTPAPVAATAPPPAVASSSTQPSTVATMEPAPTPTPSVSAPIASATAAKTATPLKGKPTAVAPVSATTSTVLKGANGSKIITE
jgi:eukaryotic-like serine/threonine-protein kinase